MEPLDAGPGLRDTAKQVPAGYTKVMDRVRLGRALGYGTRHAAKTVAAVVEAATAAPSEPARRPEPGRPSAPASAQGRPRASRRGVTSAPPGEIRKHARAIWQPLAVFSGALLLRVTGVFFALIAEGLNQTAGDDLRWPLRLKLSLWWLRSPAWGIGVFAGNDRGATLGETRATCRAIFERN